MAVPKYDEMLLPYSHILSDGQEHKNTDVAEQIADLFELTDEDRRQMLPSGRQQVYINRAGWARTYLYKAGLIEKTRRGWYRITEMGFAVLEQNPDKLDRNFLMQFPSFVAFQAPNHTAEVSNEAADTFDDTPEDLLASSYVSLRKKLSQDLLERIKENSPQFFESLVIDLMLAMGYGGSRQDAGQALGRSGDGGIDGVIKEDRLGLNNIYIQAKRWGNTVGRPDVQAFSGALDVYRANRGVFITTSQFSGEARDFVERIGKKIILIDGDYLAELMIDYGVGVTTKATYMVYEVDENYFNNE